MLKFIYTYRYELLLFSLLLVIFNKIFIYSATFYSTFVWPFNMVLLGFVSIGIFHEKKGYLNWFKNLLFFLVVAVPLFPSYFFQNHFITMLALLSYMGFYTIIFTEVMRQIIQKDVISTSIIMATLSGFLLILIVSSFSFLLMNQIDDHSFNNIQGTTIPEKYHQIVYFSSITLTTIGYGDITPATDNARLLAAFWGIIGQFYMVAVVGIIISKFTSK
jgi:hypothetical protein